MTGVYRDTRIVITGGRYGENWEGLIEFFKGLKLRLPSVTIIEGCAPGIDTWAEDLALEYGFNVEHHPAKWEEHGRKMAGRIRNIEMLDSHPNLVAAFPDANSTGTWHCVNEAMKRGIHVVLWDPALGAMVHKGGPVADSGV